MRLRLIGVPDRLWTDRTIPEGAKLLWCFVAAVAPVRSEFTFKELCAEVGISLPSLHKYLGILSRAGWLASERVSLRVVRCRSMAADTGPRLILPSDLLFDRRLPRGSWWTWAVIFRLGGRFERKDLMRITGYSHDTLSKHIRALTAHRWLIGGPQRRGARVVYTFRGANPHAVRRAQELRELERGLQVARSTPGYSQGQFILANLIRAMCPGVTILENVELTGLANIDTGGRMHCDLLVPDAKLAVEFQGSQHAGPTELYPSVEEFHAQRRRDLLKRGLCLELGFELVTMWAKDLSVEGVRQALGHRLKFQEGPEERWHVILFLEQVAERYRKAASRGQSVTL